MINETRVLRMIFRLPGRQALESLLRSRRVDIGGGGPRTLPDGSITLEAYVPERWLNNFKAEGFTFEIVEDATEVGRQRQQEVGKGDRFEGGSIAPHGFGRKE
jgi:hypothetical protein